MGKMDKNKDGKISRSEYLQLKAKYSHAAEMSNKITFFVAMTTNQKVEENKPALN